MVVARSTLDELHDELYVLACAVDDAERDIAALPARPTASDLHEILDWIMAAARPLRAREIPASSPTHFVMTKAQPVIRVRPISAR